MTECERCSDGEIDGAVETLQCPNCRDVCQWCNNPYDDGEELGDTGLVVCRPCIRDMASYKEDVVYQFALTSGINKYVDDVSGLRRALGATIDETFEDYGVNITNTNEWDIREEVTDE